MLEMRLKPVFWWNKNNMIFGKEIRAFKVQGVLLTVLPLFVRYETASAFFNKTYIHALERLQ